MRITYKDIQNLNVIIDILSKYKSDLKKIDYTHDKKAFFELMREFRQYIASVQDKKMCDMLIHSKYFHDFQKFFSEINQYYIRSLEAVQSISIISRSNHLNNSFSDLIDSDLIKECYDKKWEEIKSLNLSKAKNLVLVWTWPMPDTMLYFYENTTIKNIIGLDYNHEAVYIASELVNWLHLNNIKLYHINWAEYDYKDADIVYIPLFVMNRNKIIDRIIETWKNNVQILINAWKGLWVLIYEEFMIVNPRLKIEYRSDTFTSYRAQEVIKLVKYDF